MIKFPNFPSVDLSKLDIKTFRSIDLSKAVADITLPRIDTDKLVDAARDAAYVTVGLGVVAAQRVEARRQDLVAMLNDLPEQASSLVGQVRDLTTVARRQARDLIARAA